jgi:hypothetical protein
MAMSKLTIRGAVQINIGNRVDQDTVINRGIDAAVLDACSRYQWRGMTSSTTIAVVQGDYTKALPANTYKVLKVVVRNGLLSWEIQIRSKGWVLDRYPLPSAQPQTYPQYAFEENGILYFNVPFLAAFTIDITLMNYEAFSGDSDTLAFMPQVDNALISYATAYVFRVLQQFEESNLWQLQYERELQTAIMADRRNNGQVVSAEVGDDRPVYQDPYSPFVFTSNSSPDF